MSHGDLVILLPGISGSVLAKDGRAIWGLSAGAIVRALATGGGSINELALHGDDPDLDDLGDGITATDLIPDLHLIPGLWKIDGYGKVASHLAKELGLIGGKNFFSFPYDWRRDNRVAARKLARMSRDWLTSWRASSGNADAKLILVAHSMGGLVARYFIEVMEGWRDTRLLVTFGTPFRGSLNALGFLANGYSKGIGPLGFDFSAALRSFTSVYQLLPTYKCVETGGGLATIADVPDLPNVDNGRARAAAEFHEAIDEARATHASVAGYRDSGPRVFPIVGLRQVTFLTARFDAGGVTLLPTINGRADGGDGTVPRVSAIPRELDGYPVGTFFPEVHASVQNGESALQQAAGAITGTTVKPIDYRSLVETGDEGPGISLALDDVYPALRPCEFRAAAHPAGARLRARIEDSQTRQTVHERELRQTGDGDQKGEFSLPEGTYRLTVSAKGIAHSATDCFAVVEDRNNG